MPWFDCVELSPAIPAQGNSASLAAQLVAVGAARNVEVHVREEDLERAAAAAAGCAGRRSGWTFSSSDDDEGVRRNPLRSSASGGELVASSPGSGQAGLTDEEGGSAGPTPSPGLSDSDAQARAAVAANLDEVPDSEEEGDEPIASRRGPAIRRAGRPRLVEVPDSDESGDGDDAARSGQAGEPVAVAGRRGGLSSGQEGKEAGGEEEEEEEKEEEEREGRSRLGRLSPSEGPSISASEGGRPPGPAVDDESALLLKLPRKVRARVARELGRLRREEAGHDKADFRSLGVFCDPLYRLLFGVMLRNRSQSRLDLKVGRPGPALRSPRAHGLHCRPRWRFGTPGVCLGRRGARG